jgi:pimeloyl-ACP methyl ester carboxylesterase
MNDIQESRIIARDGTELAVFECGAVHLPVDQQGPPIVLANGLGGNIEAWRYFIDYFGTQHRIISWDYRGLYKSGATAGGTDYSVSTQADDMRAVMDHFGVQQAVCVGWSMGVQVSFEFYRHHPERVQGLILVNGTFGRPFSTAFAPLLGKSPLVPMLPAILRAVEPLAHLSEPLQPYAQKVVKTRIALKLLKTLGLVSDSLAEDMFLKLASEVAGLHMPRYMATLNSLGDHCAQAMLPHVAVPTLIIAGDRDLFTPVGQSREMAAKIPGAELLVIPSGTHYTPLEFPELIHLRATKFLRERLNWDRDRPGAIEAA